MLLLKALRSPIGVGLALVGFLGVWYIKDFDTAIYIAGAAPFESLSKFTLSVFPLFVLMGVFAMKAGLADGLYTAAFAFVGHHRGGLAMASVLGCGGIAAVNGSSLATAATMSRIAVPQMDRYGYDRRLSSGAVAAAGTLGIMIPPSLGMIVYAVLTENSIGQMFAAGIVPGLIGLALYLTIISVWCRIEPDIGPSGGSKASWKVRLHTLMGVWGIVLLFSVVMGGIFFGWFSPTEGAGIGAFGALAIGVLTRRINWPIFVEAMRESVQLTVMVLFIVVGISIFEYFITSARFPIEMAALIEGLDLPNYVVLIGIILFLLVLGGFLEVIAIIFITTPFLYPIIINMGYDPIWWGIILIAVAEVGAVSPPVGMTVFVVAKMIPGATIGTVFRGIAPFLFGDLIRLVLMILFPGLVLFLPDLLFGVDR